jgi:hypothetical protein
MEQTQEITKVELRKIVDDIINNKELRKDILVNNIPYLELMTNAEDIANYCFQGDKIDYGMQILYTQLKFFRMIINSSIEITYPTYENEKGEQVIDLFESYDIVEELFFRLDEIISERLYIQFYDFDILIKNYLENHKVKIASLGVFEQQIIDIMSKLISKIPDEKGLQKLVKGFGKNLNPNLIRQIGDIANKLTEKKDK